MLRKENEDFKKKIKPTICFFFSYFELFATLKCWGDNILHNLGMSNLKYAMVYGTLGT